MNPALTISDDQRRLDPRLARRWTRKADRKIAGSRCSEESDDRRFPFFEYDFSPSQQNETGIVQRLLYALELKRRKDEGEDSSRSEKPRRRRRVIVNASAHFQPGRHGLLVHGSRRCPLRKI